MNTESAEISDERYRELMCRTQGVALSTQERAAGWHYCPEWAWLLVLPKGRCRCGLSHGEVEEWQITGSKTPRSAPTDSLETNV